MASHLADAVLCGAVMNKNEKQRVLGVITVVVSLLGGSKLASAQEVEAPTPMIAPPLPAPPPCEYGCYEPPPRGTAAGDVAEKKRQGVDLSFDVSDAVLAAV